MTREEEIKQTKETRRRIHAMEKTLTGTLTPNNHTDIVRVKLIEARMWLGQHLATLGEINPYPDSMNPNNTNIAPTADT